MDATSQPIERPIPLSSELSPEELLTIFKGLGHELSRPLTALRAGLGAFVSEHSETTPKTLVHQVRSMTGICVELTELSRTFLEYAGVAHGPATIPLDALTLRAIVDQIQRSYSALAESLRIQWSCRLIGKDAVVVTDAAACRRVYENLISNALNFTEENGQVEVVVGLAERQGWSLSVLDSGPGIPKSELEMVFTPFYRLDQPERARVQGPGLGLSLSREWARRLGGRVTLDGGDGGGTVATVWMPVRPKAHESAVEKRPCIDK
ncbi:MAG: sensor histidine kinase [Isosphaeraceae bacterium]